MLKTSVDQILCKIHSNDLVLDVGGWACPFNRANFILDSEPYETRGFYKNIGREPFVGPEIEHFNRDTWVQRDICNHEPWPFKDKQFDWAICSHVLEDIRDPLFVCSELSRVAKKGYIEVPSRLWESCRGIESKRTAGLSHHRWLIERDSEDTLLFLMKYHGIHSHWRYSFPYSYLNKTDPSLHYLVHWWEGGIKAKEVTIHGVDQQLKHLNDFVNSTHPYSKYALFFGFLVEKTERQSSRIFRKAKRILGFEK